MHRVGSGPCGPGRVGETPPTKPVIIPQTRLFVVVVTNDV